MFKPWGLRVDIQMYVEGGWTNEGFSVEGPTLIHAVIEVQEAVVDMPCWIKVTPHSSNPPIELEEYATAFRHDLPGNPWGEERAITGYFETRIEDGELWVYSHAQSLLEGLW